MTMFNPPHPGEALREDVLPALGISVRALARHLCVPRCRLSAVLKGRTAISAELAWRLELAGLGSARMYLAEQVAHDLWRAGQREMLDIPRLDVA